MTKQKLYLLIAGCFYLSIFLLKLYNPDGIVRFCVPLFVLTTCIYNLSIKQTRLDLLVSLALLLAFVGDTIINLTPFPQLCIIAFCATHFCLALYYYKNHEPFEIKQLPSLLICVAIASIFFFAIQGSIAFTTFKIALIIYLAFLTLMLWQASLFITSKHVNIIKLYAIGGSTLFYLTDLFVCLQVLYHHKIFVAITWLLYPPALVLISSIKQPLFSKR